MRKLLLAALMVLAMSATAHATTYYVAQTAGVVGGGGALCTGHTAIVVGSLPTLNPDDIVVLCGTITTSLNSTFLTVSNSGTSGHPITIRFDLNAVLQSPAFHANGAIDCAGKSFITVDGGTNGVIQNTANGDQLANQVNSEGINSSSSPCSNMIVQNLAVHNIYMKIQGLSPGDMSCGTGHNLSCPLDDSGCLNFIGASSLVTKNTLDNCATGIGAFIISAMLRFRSTTSPR